MSTFITRGPGWLSRYSESLRDIRLGDQFPVTASFSHPSRSALGPPSLLYNGYRVFPEVLRLGRGVDHPQHLAPKLRKA